MHKYLLAWVLCIGGSAIVWANELNYLTKIENQTTDTCRYVNAKSETVIDERPCYQVADYGVNHDRLPFVLVLDRGWRAVGPDGAYRFNVFIYDNGPDDPQEGLIRIERQGLMGYADVATGKVVVEPRYQCARPFIAGRAAVGLRCQQEYEPDGEHSWWRVDKWLYIDRDGHELAESFTE